MKRFHVHISVDDLDANVRFYSTVFGEPPHRTQVRLREMDAGRPADQFRYVEARAKV